VKIRARLSEIANHARYLPSEIRSITIRNKHRIMHTSFISLKGGFLGQQSKNYLRFIENDKARSSNTVSAYKQDLRCFARFVSQDKRDEPELDPLCVSGYLEHLRQRLNLKPATVRRRLLTLKGFSGWLVDRGLSIDNPYDSLSLDLKVPKRLPRPVDPLTIRQLLVKDSTDFYDSNSQAVWLINSSKLSQNHTTRLIIKLMLVTGIRVGEVSSIKIKDVSTDGSTIHIIGKGNKERLVYVENTQLTTALSRYREERMKTVSELDEFFVNSRGNVLTPQVVRKRLKSMCENVSTSDSPTPHRFRHSAATLLIEQGADIRVVQRLLGHASISTTELYTQVTDVSLRNSLRKADVLEQFQ